jgi:hypothetical protein
MSIVWIETEEHSQAISGSSKMPFSGQLKCFVIEASGRVNAGGPKSVSDFSNCTGFAVATRQLVERNFFCGVHRFWGVVRRRERPDELGL